MFNFSDKISSRIALRELDAINKLFIFSRLIPPTYPQTSYFSIFPSLTLITLIFLVNLSIPEVNLMMIELSLRNQQFTLLTTLKENHSGGSLQSSSAKSTGQMMDCTSVRLRMREEDSINLVTSPSSLDQLLRINYMTKNGLGTKDQLN